MPQNALAVAGLLSLREPVIAPNGWSYRAFYYDEWVIDTASGSYVATKLEDGKYNPRNNLVLISPDNILAFFNSDICSPDDLVDAYPDGDGPIYFIGGQ